ncbi:MAG: cobyric acid synthase [Pseudomonadota bacterium]|nr:cobyric acid synthase [Pseudomonadota bacterium]
MQALMVQGTGSGVGKSWLCTALCRLAARRGLRVVPFKAQNMSNNAAPARMLDGGWGEIGRAQAAQAFACGQEPHVDMNPILLKPVSERGSEVVVSGRSVGTMLARDYRARRAEWWEAVTGAYARLDADLVIIEGAGSPAEINLRAGDLVNMTMAHHADAPVLLVGDIDRGGVFAALYGTLALLDEADRARVRGLLINRFRGDPEILRPGIAPFEARVGLPVRGVVPYRPDIAIEEEDSQDIRSSVGTVDICVLRLPTVANFTDLGALAREPGVGVRYEIDAERVGTSDLLVLPGSRDTEADMRWMRARGLDRVVLAAAARQTPILGLCGGLQMLGRRLGDQAGLDLLPVETAYAEEKRVRPVAGLTCAGWLLPAGLTVEGYEIHHGRTASVSPLVHLKTPDGAPDGAIQGLVAGTYLHGLLDSAPVRQALVAALRVRRGLDSAAPSPERDRLAACDAAADLVERHVDLTGLLPAAKVSGGRAA